MSADIGEIYEGTVVKLLPFGAIVRLEDGTSGLVHISEMSESFVHNVGDFLNEGDPVKVKVTGMKDGGRYEMSAKQAEPLQAIEGTPSAQALPRPRARRRVSREFEERLDDFMKDSNKRQSELRRARDGRRRGKRR